MSAWQDLSTDWQDFLIFIAYLLPVILLAILLFYRLSPLTMIKTLLKRYQKVNILIVVILGICLSISIAIKATTQSYKVAMANVANRFELVVTAPGSKVDMMRATVYLQPTATPLLGGNLYKEIANDDKVAIAAPIAYGDSYSGFPIVGSTNTFIQYLAKNNIEGRAFLHHNEAIIGVGVNLNIGDTFVPQHGIHKSFAPQYTNAHSSAGLRKKSPQEKIQPLHKKANDRYFCPVKTSAENKLPILAKQTHEHAKALSSPLSQPAPIKNIATSKTMDKSPNPNDDKQEHAHHDATITVVGKMPPTYSPWDKAIITPVESVWRIHGLPSGHPPDDDSLGEPFDIDYFAGTPAILVHPHKRFHAYPLSMKYTSNQSMAFMPPQVLEKLNAQLDDMTDILSRVAFVMIGLVLSLGIVTVALLGKLFEKHFQLLRSLGSPKRFIVSILWSYVTLLAFAATLLGSFLGYLLTLVLADYIEKHLSVLLQVQFGWTELTLCAAFFALTSLLGLIPALAGVKKKHARC